MLSTILMRSILWRGIYFLSVLLLNILLSRHFGAEISGSIYYISNIFSFVLLIGSLCLESGMGYFLSSKKINATQLGVLALVWTLLITVVIYFSFHYWASLLGTAFSRNDLLIFSVFFVSGNLLINYMVALFYAKLNFRIPNILLFASNFMLILLLYQPFQQYLGFDEMRYLYVYYAVFLLQGFLLFVVFMFQYAKRYELKILPLHSANALMLYSVTALLINVLTFIINRLDYYFVQRYCDAVSLGNYIQVNKFIQMFYILPAILASALFPLTAGGMKVSVNHRLQLLSRTLIFVYVLMLLPVIFLGKWFFPWLLGPSFDNMYEPFLLAAPGMLAFSVTHLLAAYYSGKKMLRANLTGNLIAVLIIVCGNLIFIPLYGIHGAAAVSSLACIAYFLYLLYLHHHQYGSHISGFIIFTFSDYLAAKAWIKDYLQRRLIQKN